MNYFDEIFNVSALLQAKAKKNQQRSLELIQDYTQLRDDFRQMNEQADELLDAVRALAASHGIDTEAIADHYTDLPDEPSYSDVDEFIISLPADMDFAAEFARLVEEAHQAGFTNVHPEDVLTAQEMAHAEKIQEAIDTRFEQETCLTKKDMGLLALAVILRCLCHHIFIALPRQKKQEAAPPAETPRYWTAPPEVASAPEKTASSIFSSARSAATTTTSPSINASSGVDMDGILKESCTAAPTSPISGLLDSGLLQAATAGNSKSAQIRDELQILHEQIPFDLPDNNHFKHEDIAGFHPQIGWLIGVVNLLTNTVTTYKLDTFSVVPAMMTGLPLGAGPDISAGSPKAMDIGSSANSALQVGQELSTALHVLLPVVQNCAGHKDSLMAAIVRQADVQGLNRAPMEDVASIMENTMYFERQNQNMLDNMSVATDLFSIDLLRLVGNTGITAFLDLLISAIHAIHYDPAIDGDKNFYAIRTNRILTISQLMSTLTNSAKALLTENPMDIDIGGILMTFLKVINSTSFWINIKTEYLVSEYKTMIDQENKKLDKYFHTPKI